MLSFLGFLPLWAPGCSILVIILKFELLNLFNNPVLNNLGFWPHVVLFLPFIEFVELLIDWTIFEFTLTSWIYIELMHKNNVR